MQTHTRNLSDKKISAVTLLISFVTERLSYFMRSQIATRLKRPGFAPTARHAVPESTHDRPRPCETTGGDARRYKRGHAEAAAIANRK